VEYSKVIQKPQSIPKDILQSLSLEAVCVCQIVLR
jgi:hypothetical protein